MQMSPHIIMLEEKTANMLRDIVLLGIKNEIDDSIFLEGIIKKLQTMFYFLC